MIRRAAPAARVDDVALVVRAVEVHAVPAIREADVERDDTGRASDGRLRLAGFRIVRAAVVDLAPEIRILGFARGVPVTGDHAKVLREATNHGSGLQVALAVVELRAVRGIRW